MRIYLSAGSRGIVCVDGTDRNSRPVDAASNLRWPPSRFHVSGRPLVGDQVIGCIMKTDISLLKPLVLRWTPLPCFAKGITRTPNMVKDRLHPPLGHSARCDVHLLAQTSCLLTEVSTNRHSSKVHSTVEKNVSYRPTVHRPRRFPE